MGGARAAHVEPWGGTLVGAIAGFVVCAGAFLAFVAAVELLWPVGQ